jgi:hypothetical protein
MPSQFIYHDPPIASLLILSNYFYLLNLFGWAFEWLFSAGLLGQILIGIVWGGPLSQWLHVEWQETFVVVGYIGLLLVVFQGELYVAGRLSLGRGMRGHRRYTGRITLDWSSLT